MTKHEFLGDLERRLYALPYNERRDALEYHDAYIRDADDEAAAIIELGTPEAVANNILQDYKQKEGHYTPPYSQSFSQQVERAIQDCVAWVKSIWNRPDGTRNAIIIVLAILAAIVLLPFAAAVIVPLVMIPLSLVIAAVAVIFSFGVAAVATIAAGVASIIAGFFSGDFPAGMTMVGAGILSIGIGLLFVKLVTLMVRAFAFIIRTGIAKLRTIDFLHKSKNSARG
jgi:uncharacterized membrane protein